MVWEINVKMESKYHFEKIESEIPGGFSDTPPHITNTPGLGTPPTYIIHTPGVSGNFPGNFWEISWKFPEFWHVATPLQRSSK